MTGGRLRKNNRSREDWMTITYPATGTISRRSTLQLGLGAAALASGPRVARAQPATAITVTINQSPWLDSFRRTAELYEKQSGSRIELDVQPFAGSLEKQRNSVRASRGTTDLLIMNSGWYAEMYFGGFVEPLDAIDPAFRLDPAVYTLGDSIFFDPATKTQRPTGKLMSMPIAPIVPLTYYRTDLYEAAGLSSPPTTFAELEANARKINAPPPSLWNRSARRPRPEQRFLRLRSLSLRLRRQAVSRPARRRLHRHAQRA